MRRVTLWPTRQLGQVDGIPVWIWEGHTDEQEPVKFAVYRVVTGEDEPDEGITPVNPPSVWEAIGCYSVIIGSMLAIGWLALLGLKTVLGG